MSKITQKAAVFTAISSVLGADEFSSPVVLSKEQRSSVMGIVTEGFYKGEVELADTVENKAKLADKAEMNKYTSSLINNWLRKDDRLNGGTKYVAKNPGSRAGQGDEQLKTLRALRTQFSAAGETAKATTVETAITKRVAELAAEKAINSVKKVDISTIDPELKAKLGL